MPRPDRRPLIAAAALIALAGAALLLARADDAPSDHPTLADFWDGAATWVLDVPDTGLPPGESDSILIDSGEVWSYLHASTESAGVLDSCGGTVSFPGCVTRWVSADGGATFTLPEARCLLACDQCPCAEDDLTRQQQYPRVARGPAGGWWMVFEHDAAAFVTRSPDGLVWERPRVIPYTGVWRVDEGPCSDAQRIGDHPFLPDHPDDCMAGGPPGLVLTPTRAYVILGYGSNPGHLGCMWSWLAVEYWQPCATDSLLAGSPDYGPLDAAGAAANPYFDFRYLTSAEVVRVDGTYYLLYEGARGPHAPNLGGDTQFGLGLARSSRLDAAWDAYPGSPILSDVANNWGIGHADLLISDGVTYLYTTGPEMRRGRYRLVWSSQP